MKHKALDILVIALILALVFVLSSWGCGAEDQQRLLTTPAVETEPDETVKALPVEEKSLPINEQAIETAEQPVESERRILDVGPGPQVIWTEIDGEYIQVHWEEIFPGDYNSDGLINGLDVFPLAAHFLEHSDYNGRTETTPGNNCVDGNFDGDLNGLDLFLVAARFLDRNDGWNVYHGDSADGPWNKLNTSPVFYDGCPNSRQFRHTGPTWPGWYTVRAWNTLEALESANGAIAQTPDTEPPTWPNGAGILAAVPGDDNVKIWWNAADDQTPPISYNLYQRTELPFTFGAGTKKYGGIPTYDGSPNYDYTYTVGGLEANTRYYFVLRAEDSMNPALEDDNLVVVSAASDEEPPTWPATTGVRLLELDGDSVTLYWNAATDAASPPVGYYVSYDTETPIPFDAGTTTLDTVATEDGGPAYDYKYTVSGLTSGQTYYFNVRAGDTVNPPNIDDNTVELFATPDLEPPAWDSTVGAQLAEPGHESIKVYWNGASDPLNPPVNYNLYVDTGSPVPFDAGTLVFEGVGDPDPGAYDFSFSVPGLQMNQTYYAVVRAADSANPPNEDTNTVEVSGTPLDNLAPEWVDTVGAQLAVKGNAQATVYWNAADDPDSPPVSYNIYFDTQTPIRFGAEAVRLAGVGDPGGTSYDFKETISGLNNFQTYWFAVRAEDSAPLPNEDGNLVEVSATPDDLPDVAPPVWDGIIGAQAAVPGASEITVFFDSASDLDSPPVKYNLYYDTETPIPFDGGTILIPDVMKNVSANPSYDFSYTFGGLTSGVTYYVCVRAEDSAASPNEESNTVEVNATPDDTPPVWDTTTGVQAAVETGADVTLYWNSATDASTPPVSYNVYYDTVSPIPFDGSTTLIEDVGILSGGAYDFEYTVSGLASETTHYFAVRAIDSALPPNEDANAVEVSATPDGSPPVWNTTTGAQFASAIDGDVTVYWNSASDTGHPPVRYNLYYDTETPIPFDGGTVKVSDVAEAGSGGYDHEYTVGSLTSETTYYFAVRAEDSALIPNEDANTAEVSATPDTTPPTWPDTTGAQSAEAIAGEVFLYWNAAVDGGTPPVSYNVYLDTETPIPFDSGTIVLEDVGNASDTEYDLETTILGLTSETEYFFVVRALDAANTPNEDVNEVEVSAVPDTTPPNWHGGQGADFIIPGNGEVTVFWTPAEEEGSPPVSYNMYYDTETPIPFDAGTVTLTDIGGGGFNETIGDLTNGITYYFIVRAQDSANPPNEDSNTNEVFAVPEPQWEIATLDSADNVGQHTSVVFDGAGNPLISYYNVTSGDLKYAAFDGSSWATQTVDSTGIVGQATSIAIDGSGNPAISYYDDSEGDLKYALWSGSSWSIETVADFGTVGDFNSLAFDSDGNPGIAYNYRFSGMWYAHWNGSSWDTEEVDGGGFAMVGEYCSLVFDDDDPILSYFDAGVFNLRAAMWDGSDWDIDVITDSDIIGKYTDVALDSTSQPIISYYNESDNTLEVARFNGSTWDVSTVDDSTFCGQYTSIAVGSNGTIYISYYDMSSGDLKVAVNEGGGWSSETVDSTGDVGQYSAIALNSLNLPIVSYYDATGGNLKYAWLK